MKTVLAFAALVLALFLLVPMPVAQASEPVDLSGRYLVEGRDPGGQTYAGQAEVRKQGDTYHMVWALGNTQAFGTGIMEGGVFAVTYMIRGVNVPGVALYVVKDGKLSGKFTMLGEQVFGTETLTPAPADKEPDKDPPKPTGPRIGA